MNIPDNVAAIITTLVFMMIPIIAILARHQQKMAYILNQGQGNVPNQAIAQLAAEVQDLRALVNQQTVTLDNLAESNRRIAAQLEQRVTS
jgi:hypothetical protein